MEGKTIDYYTNIEDVTEKLTNYMIQYGYEDASILPQKYWIYRLGEFKNNVGNRKAWDLKQYPEWQKFSIYIFNGQYVDSDALGNILYGYIGKAYGIPQWILLIAAGLAQIKAGTSTLPWIV